MFTLPFNFFNFRFMGKLCNALRNINISCWQTVSCWAGVYKVAEEVFVERGGFQGDACGGGLVDRDGC